MGNQPSSPSQTPIVDIPPLPAPCDLQCQKQKQLKTLKQALDAVNPEEDPAGYEKARIAYFTVLNGPGWLANEKHKIASQDVEPVLTTYKQQYDTLKGEQQAQSVFSNLATALTSQKEGDQETNSFLTKQLASEKDKAATSDRLNQLGGQSSSYLSWAIDILIVILGLFVGYKVYSRFFGQITVSPDVPDLTSV
jgi:hypothetical protein